MSCGLGGLGRTREQIPFLKGCCRSGQVTREVGESLSSRGQSVCLVEDTVVEGFQEESHGPVLDLLVPLCVLVSQLDNWH